MLARFILAGMKSSVAMAQTPAEAVVAVETARPGPLINCNICRHFAEHLDRGNHEGIWVGPASRIPAIRGYRRDVVDARRNLDVPVIRWPGGCSSEVYDWRGGIGPPSERSLRTRMCWSDTVDRNDFGTHA